MNVAIEIKFHFIFCCCSKHRPRLLLAGQCMAVRISSWSVFLWKGLLVFFNLLEDCIYFTCDMAITAWVRFPTKCFLSICKVWLYFPIYLKTIKPETQGCQLQVGASTKKTQSYVLMHYAGLMSLQAWLLYCTIIITCIFYPWIMILEDTSVVTLGFEF